MMVSDLTDERTQQGENRSLAIRWLIFEAALETRVTDDVQSCFADRSAPFG
jgi:hypothetical protein